MSELVEENFFANNEQNFTFPKSAQNSSSQVLKGLILLIVKANTEGYCFKIQQSETQRQEGKLKLILHSRFASLLFDLITEILVDMRNRKLLLKTSFLDQERYLLTESSFKRKVVCRKFFKINNEIQYEGFKFIQNMQNGKILLTTANEQSEAFFTRKELIWTQIKMNIRKVCKIAAKYSIQILQTIDKERYKIYYLKNGGEQLKKIKKQEYSYTKLVKQLEVSHINFGFSSKADESSFPTFEKSHQQEFRLKEFHLHSSHEKFEHDSRKLFLLDFEHFLDVPFHSINYEMEYNQSKAYGSYLKTPVPRDPNPGENKFIYNQIQIVKPETIKFKDSFHEGGFNKILVSKISFYYCESTSSKKNKLSTTQNRFIFPGIVKENAKSNEDRKQPILTKMIAVKLPKRKSEKWDEKYENEKNIIRFFKSGVSAYILKYYVSRQPNFEYRDCLLIDFLPNSQPLSNYIEIFRETLSLNSKTYLIVNLANSLRFLSDYHIVHMDLNLNNVLVYRDYLTKVIDFGEAYNPKIASSDGSIFKRGYTFPYSPPQYFQRKSKFINKQDVFSLGLIIWRIIFNDYPFFPSPEVLQTYRNRTYFNKILLAPERGEGYGNIETINFIYRLIFKCLSTNELFRCETSWITIFFKIIYFYLL